MGRAPAVRQRLTTGPVLVCSFLLPVAFARPVAVSEAFGRSGVSAAETRQQSDDFFESRIRPILVEHCLECHSGAEAEGELQLTTRQAVLTGGVTGPAARPGDAAASLLYQAVLRMGELQMPPDESLPASAVRALGEWINGGLHWPEEAGGEIRASEFRITESDRDHWAFRPVRRPLIPTALLGRSARTPVDAFVIAKLEAAGLQPAPAADRQTLIRRAWFDLVGLPPPWRDVQQFLADQRPTDVAFRDVVDRLLASPHYGERWGRHWLDVARYADNKGYVFFEEKKYPWAWTYRDYVTRAFNEDTPFDRFVLEQLAADQLDLGEDRRPLAAMGFLTLGARFMNNTHDVIDDRIDVVTRGLMGLTLTCARCHDHKYDPLSQADYYGLYGVFRSSPEPMLPPEFLPQEDTEEYRAFASGLHERQEKLASFVSRQREQIATGARERVGEYLAAVHSRRHHPTTQNFMLLTDKGSLNPAMIARWESYLKRTRLQRDPIWTIWHALAELPQDEFARRADQVLAQITAQDENDAFVNPHVRRAFTESVSSMNDVVTRYAAVLQAADKQWRDAVQQAAGHKLKIPTRLRDNASEALRQVLYGLDAPPSVPRELTWGFLDLLPDRPTQGEFRKLLKEVETWSISQPGAPARAMVLTEAARPYDPTVFIRGNPHRSGRPVPRRFPELLSTSAAATFRTGSGRLELARGIADGANPLTARVFVNRVWLHHFGHGLVETPSDFGLRSQPPSHPRLLDWLARSFIDNGWSVKQLHRTILNTATWQQSGDVAEPFRARGESIDPTNRLLWRHPRRRLDFETTRDALLAVSGSLDETVGGPAIDLFSGFAPRRSVYGFIDRMDLPGLLRAFDFPEPAATSPQREQTTIPPQALFFLNDEFLSQCATRLARRLDGGRPDIDDRVTAAWRVLFSRNPDHEEQEFAAAWLATGRSVPPSAWTYGYGTVQKERVAGFAELVHWTGERWQAGPKLPDPQLGWVFMDRRGGHPAATLERCSIRRWTSPVGGTVAIAGSLQHHPPQGNGVRGRIVSSREGVLGTWKVHNSSHEHEGISVAVRPGDTIDFVVDFDGNILHDEHEWPIRITHVDGSQEWDSEKDFRGGQADRWAQFLHALLMTNEFVHVD